ncbi:uncharacterized protein LOC133349820 isoform X2 [Lethenteron reissneri]|uniref:uncharacterized protein LOC133349820 isoform X2 n=1 Tax=Lethenteron reissneri TaxID=7753 RepID=UPI002AB70987|nr:uncharacterized protein LOC133349820 isoform X2 [Lethenteron reissneri]
MQSHHLAPGLRIRADGRSFIPLGLARKPISVSRLMIGHDAANAPPLAVTSQQQESSRSHVRPPSHAEPDFAKNESQRQHVPHQPTSATRRAKAFSENELEILVVEFLKRRHNLLKTGAKKPSNHIKMFTWNQIAQAFKAKGFDHRNIASCQKRWHDLKRSALNKVDLEKLRRSNPGWQFEASPSPLTRAENKLLKSLYPEKWKWMIGVDTAITITTSTGNYDNPEENQHQYSPLTEYENTAEQLEMVEESEYISNDMQGNEHQSDDKKETWKWVESQLSQASVKVEERATSLAEALHELRQLTQSLRQELQGSAAGPSGCQ